LRIARRLEEIAGESVDEGLVAVRRGETGPPLQRATVVEADHPVPGEASLSAGEAALAIAGSLSAGDLALCCITGGSSALLSVPPAGVPFEAKRRLHELLLSSGASIHEVNTIRKHVSGVKGGRLAARMVASSIVNLTVSDVAGDALDFITGPTVADTTTVEEAVALLHRYRLWDRVDRSIRSHLGSAAATSPDLSAADIQSTLLVSGRSACAAMAAAAARFGYRCHVLSTTFSGEAVAAGRMIAEEARACLAGAGPVHPPCLLVGCGGESTVPVGWLPDVAGEGGPNQELVLAAASVLQPTDDVVILAMDTDGSDGGSNWAGGIADGETAGRAARSGAGVEEHLRSHRSGVLLGALGDALDTGPTGTNVNDLFVAVVGR
jgi:glycerate-2-kinase